MDDTLKPQPPRDTPRRPRPDLESWRGDIRQAPPAWRRRPHSRIVRELWDATRPLIGQIGEGRSWE